MYKQPYESPFVLLYEYELEDIVRTSLQGTVDGSDSTYEDWWGQD